MNPSHSAKRQHNARQQLGIELFPLDGPTRVDVLSEDRVNRLVTGHREVMTKFGHLSPKGELRV